MNLEMTGCRVSRMGCDIVKVHKTLPETPQVGKIMALNP